MSLTTSWSLAAIVTVERPIRVTLSTQTPFSSGFKQYRRRRQAKELNINEVTQPW